MAEFQLNGKIIELYVKQRNLDPSDPLRANVTSQLGMLIDRWNKQDGPRCSCGVILQIKHSGTLINCEWSRKLTGLPAIDDHDF
jgi:hypothetical protein